MFVVLKLFFIAPAVLAEFDPNDVNGTGPVDISEVPYQVSVHVAGQHVCAGSILNTYSVLTALHCTKWGVINEVYVRAGSSYPNEGGQKILVKGTCTYANDNELEGYRDLQILILTVPLVLGANVRPIALSYADISEDSIAVVTGWNIIEPLDKLQRVVVTKRKDEDCTGIKFDPYLTCFLSEEVDLNNMKTGGPVVVDDEQVALDGYSYRNPCDDNRGMYIMLKPHRSFIAKCLAYYTPNS